MTTLRQDDVVFLIGAGASVDAGIPHSQSMIEEVEGLIQSKDDKWSAFSELYYYIRSAVHYADGIQGVSGRDVLFNIERLVNTLEELQKKESHPLYPFVGAWNPRLQEVVGSNFSQVSEFRTAIIDKLRQAWIGLHDYSKASYFKGLLGFQKQYEYPLRVFTLNYDLCVEKACGLQDVQRGFDKRRRWDWRLFDDAGPETAPVLLYKLHGSTDWRLDDSGVLTYSDSPQMIPASQVAIIFGTAYKFQYVDPFLFFAYELRRWTLDDARIIVSIGYGFGDEHINGILSQALRQKEDRRLLAVAPVSGSTEVKQAHIAKELLLPKPTQIIVRNESAKKFLSGQLTLEYLVDLLPDEEPDLIAPLGDHQS